MNKLVPAAAVAAGLPKSSIEALLTAFPLGAEALAKVPGATKAVLAAATAAFDQSYITGIRYVISLITNPYLSVGSSHSSDRPSTWLF